MLRFPVSAKKLKLLEEKMAALGVSSADLEESFTHSSGHGGQNVNKVATCVVLIHKPTGIMVKCQRERTQGLNRFLARRMLVDKLEAQIEGKKSALKQKREKIRRQKRRRSRRAKKKMLADKRYRSSIKENRKSVDIRKITD